MVTDNADDTADEQRYDEYNDNENDHDGDNHDNDKHQNSSNGNENDHGQKLTITVTKTTRMRKQGSVSSLGAGVYSTNQHRSDLRYGRAEGPFALRTRRGHRHRPRVLWVLLPMRSRSATIATLVVCHDMTMMVGVDEGD